MTTVLQFTGIVIIGVVGVASASVLLDRLFNGATYVRDAREKGNRK